MKLHFVALTGHLAAFYAREPGLTGWWVGHIVDGKVDTRWYDAKGPYPSKSAAFESIPAFHEELKADIMVFPGGPQ